MALTTRQKILIPTLAIVAILLIWQLYLMVLDRYPVDNPFTRSKELSLSSPDSTPVIHLPEKSVNDPVTGSNSDPKTVVNSPDPEARQQQSAYLQLVSEYQIAQIKRMIARDYEDIAVANRNTAKAMLEISNMTGTKTIPQVSLNSMPQSNPDQDYRLVYTSREGGEWGATLRYQGKLLDINVGTVLPDGAKVIAIDSTSVALGTDDKQLLISFLGTTDITTKPSANATSSTVQDQKQPPAISATKIIKPIQVSTPDAISKPIQLTVTHTSDTDSKAAASTHGNKAKTTEVPLAQTIKTPINHHAPESSKLLSTHLDIVDHLAQGSSDNMANATVAPLPRLPANSSSSSHANRQIGVVSKSTVVAAKHTAPKSNHIVANSKTKVIAKITNPKSEAPPKPTRHFTKMEQSLFQVAPHYYTIQLMSNSDLDIIKRCIATNNLDGQARYYKTYLQGKPWYILLYRQFPTAQSALSAISELPINLQRWSPFAKSYVRVHEELQATA